jgi:hypothetical protein
MIERIHRRRIADQSDALARGALFNTEPTANRREASAASAEVLSP